MPKKRFSAEQIVTLLRQIEVSMAQGKATPIACRDAGISQQSYYRWRKAFSDVLIADLDQAKNTPQFADMFAQTLAYGIFTAHVMADPGARFTREEAQRLIPRSNPFLRNFFIDISNPRLDDEPFACFVNDLVALLANTDMSIVLANFGHRTKQEDPVVHFYETFLAAYDPKLRETRGVHACSFMRISRRKLRGVKQDQRTELCFSVVPVSQRRGRRGSRAADPDT